jgi:hypothetical protein
MGIGVLSLETAGVLHTLETACDAYSVSSTHRDTEMSPRLEKNFDLLVKLATVTKMRQSKSLTHQVFLARFEFGVVSTCIKPVLMPSLLYKRAFGEQDPARPKR